MNNDYHIIFNIKFLFLCSLCFNWLGAQDLSTSVIVEYSEITNFGINAETKAILRADENKSVYIRQKLDYDIDENDKVIDDRPTKNSQPLEIYQSSILDGSIYLRDFSLTDQELVLDKLANIEWSINPNAPKEFFLDFKCTKAVGDFRGRKYEVWFTTEIPIKFGPWKLHGLPGLVLKVVDKTQQIFIDAKKITLKRGVIENSFNPETYGKQIIDMQKYVKLIQQNEDNYFSDVMSRVQSTMPRGSSVRDVKRVNDRGNYFEISYEWQNKD